MIMDLILVGKSLININIMDKVRFSGIVLLFCFIVSCKKERKEEIPYYNYLRCSIHIDCDTFDSMNPFYVYATVKNISNSKLSAKFSGELILQNSKALKWYTSYLDFSGVNLGYGLDKNFTFNLTINQNDSIVKIFNLKQLYWGNFLANSSFSDSIKGGNYDLDFVFHYPVDIDPSKPQIPDDRIFSNTLKIIKK